MGIYISVSDLKELVDQLVEDKQDFVHLDTLPAEDGDPACLVIDAAQRHDIADENNTFCTSYDEIYEVDCNRF